MSGAEARNIVKVASGKIEATLVVHGADNWQDETAEACMQKIRSELSLYRGPNENLRRKEEDIMM